jgi:hypothetical protein
MRTASIDFQLVPPYDYCQNAAERTIGIWKDHFVAGLVSLDPHFPMHLWCPLIDQCTQTLNLMRPSRMNPRLSAKAQLNGAFDYNKTPLAPTSTKVLIHETPNRRRTWAVHGVDGWYIRLVDTNPQFSDTDRFEKSTREVHANKIAHPNSKKLFLSF